MNQTGRPRRVGELIREEIATMLSQEILKDVRLGFISVMGVKMSRDLRYANVYVSLFGTDQEKKSSLVALQSSAGYIRGHLRKILRTKVIPNVRFYEDDSLDKVYELEKVFEHIHEQNRNKPMIRLSFEEIIEELNKYNSFLLCSHANPDGDAIGSMLGMSHLLKALGKKNITCALADPVPEIYKNLPGAGSIIGIESSPPPYELAILMDVAKLDRIGKIAEWIPDKGKVLLLDHHLAEEHDAASGFSDPEYAATGEIIYELWQSAGINLTKDAAHCLYVAQITDTGVYRFSNTNVRSHHISAGLIESGIDHATIAAEVYDNMSIPKFDLLRCCLSRMTISVNGKIAYSWINRDDLNTCKASKEHLDGLVNYARNLEGIDVGILFYEIEPGTTKVSFRSQKYFNSAEFLEEFGGGGHAPAAGATLQLTLEEAKDKILTRLNEVMDTN